MQSNQQKKKKILPGFSDPYCMLGIQPGNGGAPPSPQPNLSTHSPHTPPASPRQTTRALSDGGDNENSHHEKLRKHHRYTYSSINEWICWFSTASIWKKQQEEHCSVKIVACNHSKESEIWLIDWLIDQFQTILQAKGDGKPSGASWFPGRSSSGEVHKSHIG